MSAIGMHTLPAGITSEIIARLLNETRSRESILNSMIQRFQERYQCTLQEFESRLERGEGAEHPDWEDSIEWRNAVEALRSVRLTRSVFEWLLRSISPSPAS